MYADTVYCDGELTGFNPRAEPGGDGEKVRDMSKPNLEQGQRSAGAIDLTHHDQGI